MLEDQSPAEALTKIYDPISTEARWQQAWEQEDAFHPDPSAPGEPFAVVIPPPNVTGSLHMGHAFNTALIDTIVRFQRMQGKNVLCLPGTDHASIAVQSILEKQLKEEGSSRKALGREAFLGRAWAWKEESGGRIIAQLKRLGYSVDWQRQRFTLDAQLNRAVVEAFVRLHQQGLIYRGEYLVNWCPASGSAVSDLEVEMKEVDGFLWHFRYPLTGGNGFLEVATTRPETLLGDTGVAVNPDDSRYAALVGKTLTLPLVGREIPIVADSHVDPAFGTGCVKVTPAHDPNDFAIGKRHGLPLITVMAKDGSMNAAAAQFAGLDRFEARKAVVAAMEAEGFLVRVEPYRHAVPHSERGKVPVEPLLSTQWFVKTEPLAARCREALAQSKPQFVPERWSKVYLDWLTDIRDWCISRQLWWGHRIPVWYAKGVDREKLTEADLRDPTKIHVSLDGPADPENWVQEDDVLDTWASSWLWPFATLGWPDAEAQAKAGFSQFYPTTTLATGADIIFFWVARMIMAGLEFAKPGAPVEERIPFKHVYFNGIVRDKQGRKMSKTLGNSPDPLDLIVKYGADGLRFGLLQIAPLGQDVKFDEDRIESGKGFCNKLWNACRFRQMSGAMSDNSSLVAILARLDPAHFDDDDHAILAALLDTTRTLEKSFADFEFAGATQRLYSFFWNDFCDWYVEVAKTRVQDPLAKDHALAVQDLVIRQFLLLFEPFAPFITEELWTLLGYASADKKFIQNTRLETAEVLAAVIAKRGTPVDPAAAGRVEQLKQVSSLARQLKMEQSVPQKRDVKFFVLAHQAEWLALEKNAAKLARLVGAADIGRTTEKLALPAVVTPLGTLFLDTGVKIDPAAERARLTKELDTVTKHIAGTEARLGNEAFTSKAPPAVLEGARKQLADQRSKASELQRLLAALG